MVFLFHSKFVLSCFGPMPHTCDQQYAHLNHLELGPHPGKSGMLTSTLFCSFLPPPGSAAALNLFFRELFFRRRPVNSFFCLSMVMDRVVFLSARLVNFVMYFSNSQPLFMSVAAILSRYPAMESIILSFGVLFYLKPPGFCVYFNNSGFIESPPKGVPFSARTAALHWDEV